MNRIWRTFSPLLRTESTAALTAVTAPPLPAAAGVGWVSVWACCMRIPSRHWEGDRYPADHVRRGCDEFHGNSVSLMPDSAAYAGRRSPRLPTLPASDGVWF